MWRRRVDPPIVNEAVVKQSADTVCACLGRCWDEIIFSGAIDRREYSHVKRRIVRAVTVAAAGAAFTPVGSATASAAVPGQSFWAPSCSSSS
jgi:hypothetical protein